VNTQAVPLAGVRRALAVKWRATSAPAPAAYLEFETCSFARLIQQSGRMLRQLSSRHLWRTIGLNHRSASARSVRVAPGPQLRV
jgi:hypothetical protein